MVIVRRVLPIFLLAVLLAGCTGSPRRGSSPLKRKQAAMRPLGRLR
jgi:hypothetical protein